MDFAKHILGYRSFLSEPEICQSIRHSKNYNADIESPEQAKCLLIFETSKQHTWLVSTNERLYCILDDVRKPEPHINWSVQKKTLIGQPGEDSPIKSRSKSENTGLVDVGLRHKNWLFSKRLFTQQPIDKVIQNLLTDS